MRPPNRPASLPCETLTIPKVFRRAGCLVTANAASSPVPAPPGATWSDMEMHDAMQIHWSRFANQAQWAMWVFYAALHESGTNLGGIMFDDIGPNHRQGTALFIDSFIADPPPGDPNPAAWIDRMRFWTAVHEMGHSFNLAHSWQKSLGAPFGTPWVPLADEPEARSFMNYPFNVAGGQAAFFADFEYRFSDQELVFVRHAPERFVQMGNAAWFDHHGFEEAAVPAEPTLQLELRVNRERARYEFMEPVWLELKLKNIGDQPRLVDADVLDADSLTVILKKQGKEARQLIPFRQKCTQPVTKALMPGDSIYGTVLASAGLNGWDVAEPGTYTIQAAAHLGDEDVVSAAARPQDRPAELTRRGVRRRRSLRPGPGARPHARRERRRDSATSRVQTTSSRRSSSGSRSGGSRCTPALRSGTLTRSTTRRCCRRMTSRTSRSTSRRPIRTRRQVSSSPCSSMRPRRPPRRSGTSAIGRSPSGRRSGWKGGCGGRGDEDARRGDRGAGRQEVNGRPIKPEVIEELKETRKEPATQERTNEGEVAGLATSRAAPARAGPPSFLVDEPALEPHGRRGTPRSRRARAGLPAGRDGACVAQHVCAGSGQMAVGTHIRVNGSPQSQDTVRSCWRYPSVG